MLTVNVTREKGVIISSQTCLRIQSIQKWSSKFLLVDFRDSQHNNAKKFLSFFQQYLLRNKSTEKK